MVSAGSCTDEWLLRTFTSPLRHVVYVSASPWPRKLGIAHLFKRVVDVWRYGWDEELSTVPADVVSRAIREQLDRGERNIMAHYLQPHAPFVRGSWLNKLRTGKANPGFLAYKAAETSPAARREFIRAYEENVAYVMEEVARLLSWLREYYPGAVVAITSDHGECLGRWHPLLSWREPRKTILRLLGIHKVFGHPPGRRWPELIHVPWLTLEVKHHEQ